MKNSFIIYSVSFIVCLFVFFSCENLTDIQQKYLDMGEQVYVGKPDSLTTRGGYYRINISGLMHYASTAEKCVIKWKSSEDEGSVEIPSSEWMDTGILDVMIDNLSEDSYRLFVQTSDRKGNKSLNEEVNGVVYGDNFILSITPKLITRVRKTSGKAIIAWTTSAENVSFVELKYETLDGFEHVYRPANVENDTILNWKPEGRIEYRTASIPEVNAIDTLYTSWNMTAFPK